MHLTTLRTILGRINLYVNVFIHVVDRRTVNLAKEIHICIIARYTPENGDVHRYNIPTENEVTMIILGEQGEVGKHDVIIQRDSRMFKEQLQGSKHNGLKSSLYHWKVINT